jgi:kynurenine formamidase
VPTRTDYTALVMNRGPLLALIAAASCTAAPATTTTAPTAASTTPAPLEGELVDLSHAFDADTIYWPTSPSGFELTKLHEGPTEGGYFYAANTLCAPEHGGTHLDAPIHFAEGRSTADTVPLSRLVGPAVVIDIAPAAATDPDTTLQPADIERFEAEHGAIAANTIVLVRTGWSERWPDRKRYLGDDTPGDASNLHFPGISKEAAQALVDREVAAVGIDTASIDHGPSQEFWAHRVLMAADIPAFENLMALDQLPATGATVIALPMKIGGGSGGPLRAIAIVNSAGSGSRASGP